MNLISIPAFSSRSTIHVVIESPRGSALKLKYDPQLEAMTLSRPLPSGLVFPHDWGFVPSTRASDGDPLDAMVLWDQTSFPGTVVQCRLLGGILRCVNCLRTEEREVAGLVWRRRGGPTVATIADDGGLR